MAKIPGLHQWLSSAQEEIDGIFPVHEDEQLVKEEMWSHIQSATGTATYRPKISIRNLSLFAYPLAACLLLMVTFFIDKNTAWLSNSTVINNTISSVARKVTVGGFQFTVQPYSQCNIQQSMFGTKMNVKFCGAVAIMNTSAQNKDLNICTGLFNCTVHIQDNINLHKGQTYLAMTDQDYHMISATKDEIMDGMPRPFSARLEERFHL